MKPNENVPVIRVTEDGTQEYQDVKVTITRGKERRSLRKPDKKLRIIK